MFERIGCSTCNSIVGFFKIKDGQICFICLSKVQKDTGLDIDAIHELDINNVKISL